MLNRTSILATFVAGAVITSAYFAALNFPPPYNYAVFIAGVLVALLITYGFIYLPQRYRQTMHEVASRLGLEHHVIDGESHLLGTFEDRAVAISEVTLHSNSLLGYRVEWVGTWTLYRNLPGGFRMHPREETRWYHELSGAREVRIPPLSATFLVEGDTFEAVEPFLVSRADLFSRIPRPFLLSGADPFRVTDIESDRGALTCVSSRVRSPDLLEKWIREIVEICELLEDPNLAQTTLDP